MSLSNLIAQHSAKTLMFVQLLSVLTLISSFYLAHLISDLPSLFSQSNKQEIVAWVATAFATILVFACSTSIRGFLGEIIKNRTTEFLLQTSVKSTLKSEECNALADGANSLYEKLTYNTRNVAMFVHMVTTILPGSTLLTVAGVIYLSTISISLLMLILVLLPVSIRILFSIGKRVSSASETLSLTLSSRAKLYIERLLALNTIKVMRLSSQVGEEIDSAERRTFLGKKELSFWDSVVNAVFLFFVFSLVCIVVGVGALLVADGVLSTDKLLEFITVLIMLAYSLASISDVGSVYSKYKKSISFLNQIMAEPDIKKERRPNNLVSNSEHIVIRDLVHSYGAGSRFKLEIPHLEIQKSSKCAVIGCSGSGKTTLMKLLLGVIKPQQGHVFVAGKSRFSELHNSEEFHSFSVVEQEPLVFSGTVLKNIVFNEKDYDKQWLKKCLIKSTFCEVLNRKGVDINFDVGTMGSKLSGGERQRLALCRALYADAEVLVLDEALSSVDRICANNILRNLCKIDRTIIFVTHDLSSVSYFNEYVLLEDGKLKEKELSKELVPS